MKEETRRKRRGRARRKGEEGGWRSSKYEEEVKSERS